MSYRLDVVTTFMMNSLRDLVGEFGGTTAFAAAIQVNVSTASEMKRRGSIPVRYWPSLIAAAEERGLALTYDTLVAIHSPITNSEVAA